MRMQFRLFRNSDLRLREADTPLEDGTTVVGEFEVTDDQAAAFRGQTNAGNRFLATTIFGLARDGKPDEAGQVRFPSAPQLDALTPEIVRIAQAQAAPA